MFAFSNIYLYKMERGYGEGRGKKMSYTQFSQSDVYSKKRFTGREEKPAVILSSVRIKRLSRL